MKEVWSLTCDTPGQKIVLLALADCEREDAGCWPSISKLAEKCSMSRQGVLNQLDALEKRGWISRDKGKGKSSLYRLTLPVHAMDYQPEKKHGFKDASAPVRTAPHPAAQVVHSFDQSTPLTSPLNGHPVVHTVDPYQSTQLTGVVHTVDSNHKEPKGEPEVEPCAESIPERFKNRWNLLPKPFPKIQAMSDGRRTALRARLRDKFWKENFETAIKEMESSEFMKGGNDRSWIADVDFFLQPDSVAKIIEGKYRQRVNGNGHKPEPKPEDPRWAEFLVSIGRPGEWTMKEARDYLHADFRKWKEANPA